MRSDKYKIFTFLMKYITFALDKMYMTNKQIALFHLLLRLVPRKQGFLACDQLRRRLGQRLS